MNKREINYDEEKGENKKVNIELNEANREIKNSI